MSPRAFLLEQDPTLNRLVAALLERQGMSVIAPVTTEEALKLDHGDFDVFVVDLTTPDGAGYEVLSHLRSCCNDTFNCIVLVAPGSQGEVFRRLGAYTPFRILEKPFELSEFDEAIRGYVDRRQHSSIRVQCLSCEQEKAFAAPSEDVARELARGEGWRVVTFVRRDQSAPGRSEFVTVCPGCTTAVAT